MSKTETTKQLEREIYKATKKQGTFCCFEVTIGWYGKERVDYLTYDTKGLWRCYEIKASKADFHSKAKKTFVGHYNHYVLTKELYEEVQDEIPNHIGVYIDGVSVKRAKYQELAVDEEILKDSFIRSLYRGNEKLLNSEDDVLIDKMKRRIHQEHNQYRDYYDKYWNLRREIEGKYGTRWYK